MPTKISDLVADTALKLGNRQDLASGSPSRVAKWLSQAYTDLAMSYPFEELEFTEPDTFAASVDTYPYPATMRGIKAVTLVYTDGTTVPIRRKHIRVIRQYTSVLPGPPYIYAPFARQIIVRPTPDQAYGLLWDGWAYPNTTDNIIDTIVQLPPDWFDILEYCAAMRGHMDLMERDKAGELHTLLYGDPTDVDTPGLIKAKLLTKPAENVDSEYAMRPNIRRYTSRS